MSAKEEEKQEEMERDGKRGKRRKKEEKRRGRKEDEKMKEKNEGEKKENKGEDKEDKKKIASVSQCLNALMHLSGSQTKFLRCQSPCESFVVSRESHNI